MGKYVMTFESFLSGSTNDAGSDKETLILIFSTEAVTAYEERSKMNLEDLSNFVSKQEFGSYTEKEKYIQGIERGAGIDVDSVSYRTFTDNLPYKVFLDPAYDADEESDLYNDAMDDVELDDNEVESYQFYSKDDLTAFCKGLDDADGWESIIAVSEDEFKEYVNYVYTPEERQKIYDSL